MSVSHMQVNLVFTAFSGSHQDAIAKGYGMDRENVRAEHWDSSVSAD